MPSVRPHRSFSTSVPIIGIAGGIGSGKSSVVRGVRSVKLQIIDADQIGHELLRTPPFIAQIQQVFGDVVFSENGQIDRQALAGLVYGGSEDHQRRLRQLQDILHPAIHRETCSQMRAVPHDVDAVIWDAALLLEAGWADQCDALIFMDTPRALREKRVQETRNWSPQELERRESSQMSLQEKRAHCEFVVDNSGPVEESIRQMEHVLELILQRLRRAS